MIGSAEETKYSYDNNGNLIGTEDSKGKTVLEYDYENRLVKFTKPDGTWTQFTYDPFGRRYSKETSDGQKEIYLYDGLHIIEVYDGNTMALKSSFVHSDVIDEALFGTIQGQDLYYHQDGLNSVKALTDISGNIIVNYDYDAWGNPVGTMPSIANPFTYTGREYDKETGMYYYRARYYDPKVGRFISKDPIKDGINFYSYVGNNPVNYTDPMGLYWLEDLSNFSAGFGDTISFGATRWIRQQMGTDDVVNKCSDAYRAGSWGAFALGGSRLAYAGLAKGYSMVASSGAAASAFRSGLRTAFGGGKSLRPPNLAKYPTDDALRAAAGRTNPYANAYGAGVAATGAYKGSGCGCSQ